MNAAHSHNRDLNKSMYETYSINYNVQIIKAKLICLIKQNLLRGKMCNQLNRFIRE